MSARLRRFREYAHRHTFVAASSLVAGVALIANCFLWWRRHEITREHEDVRHRGEAMVSAVADRARIQGDLTLLEDALDQIERNLAAEESMEVNLGYFYRLEKISRVRLERIDQLVAPPAASGSYYRSVPISLQVEGSYRNILGFIRELESGPRVLRVRDYRIERDEDVAELHAHFVIDLLARP